MNHRIVGVCLMLSIATLAAQQPNPAPAAPAAAPAAQQPPAGGPPPGWTPVDTKVLYRVPGMENVKVTEGVVFKKVGDVELKLDVYSPPNATGQRPAVVFVSGGSTESRGWGLYKDYGRITAASNLVAVKYDKRYAQGPAGMASGGEDTADAIKFVRENAAKYNVDPDRICIWTFSAGGALAQLGLLPENKVKCVVAWYGLGQAGPRQKMLENVATMPPMLVVRAGRDGAGLNNAIDAFSAMALFANAPLTVINYPQGLHAFEIEDFRPEPKTAENRAETARIMKFTLEWIKAQAER